MKTKCPIYKECGACQFLHLDYSEELKLKEEYIKELFPKNKVNRIIGADNPENYRNKVHIAYDINRNKEIISGPYKESTHKIIPYKTCYLNNKIADDINFTIKKLMKELKLRTFDEYKLFGFLRHTLIRVGTYSNEVMVVLVTGNVKFKNQEIFISKLVERHPQIKTIIRNYNDKRTSMVLGNKEEVLYGKGYIEDTLNGLKFRISSSSFYQINTKQCEKLYKAAIDAARISKDDIVLDTYSGIGTITLSMANSCKEVIGVEINKQAVKDAINNAKANKIDNAHFVCEDASKYMDSLAKEKANIDILIMDPPRNGSDKTFLNAVLKLKPKRIVYISCGPETQVRDLKLLTNDYKITSIQPVDMFPRCGHVETVCLLSKKTPV